MEQRSRPGLILAVLSLAGGVHGLPQSFVMPERRGITARSVTVSDPLPASD